MNKALLNVDYTVDFVSPEGALTCGRPAQNIEKDITALTRAFIANGDYVVFAVDKHEPGDEYHPETALFPPHNISGTKGRELFGALEALYRENRHKKNVFFMDKTRYSCFAGTNLFLRLAERGVSELHLAGVCTDICVLHTLVDAYNLGFSLVVHEKCVASFNEAGHRWALEHFKNCLGAAVV